MKKLTLNILLLIIIVSGINGQNVNVTSAFDSSRIYIGDQIHFNISVEQPADLKLSSPVLKDTLCKNIEILSGPVVDTSATKDGRLKIVSKYLVTSFDSGFYQMRPVFAELKDPSGIKRFYSEYSQLKVMRVKIAPADTAAKIFDIIKPYRAPVTAGEIIPWVLLVMVLGALTWGIIRYIRNHRKVKPGIEPEVNPDPPHVIAFMSLEALQSEQLWQKGEIKLYYTKLTEILRQYLENRFQVFSLELTTAETLDALVKTGFKKDNAYNMLKTLLTVADLVKFAKYKPEPSDHELQYKNSWDFVDITKAVEPVPVETAKISREKEESL